MNLTLFDGVDAPDAAADEKPFKTCGVCQDAWATRNDFLTDAKITLTGYQANFVAVEKGLFLFNHTCGATLSLKVHELADLYPGPIYEEPKTGSRDCPGYCLHANEFRPCPAQCECAYVRDILQLLR